MPLNNVRSHHSSVPEYQLSGIPYATASQTNEVTGSSAITVNFGNVTRWLIVKNTGASPIRIGFSTSGVLGSNYMLVGTSQTTERMEMRLKQLFVTADGTGKSDFCVLAGLTTCDHGIFPTLSASLGYVGIG